MRVTNTMMNNQVVFNIQRSLGRFMNLQNQMSSGRRINKPSDDPIGTLRDLDYRTQLANVEQFRANISQGQNWLANYDNVLSDAKNLMSEAKDIAIAMSNDTFDETHRRASANEVKAIFDRMVQLANVELGGRQMFSGHRTQLKPFRVGSSGVTYLGDQGKIEFEIDNSVRQKVNITADEVFLKSTSVLGAESDLNIGLTAGTLLSDLNGGSGVDLAPGTFTITDRNLVGVSATVDLTTLPAVTTIGEAVSRINAALTAAGMSADVSVVIGEEGNNLKVVTTASGQVSPATELVRLWEGSGVDLSQGNIRVTNGGAIGFSIDLSKAITLDDIITTFDTEVAANGLANVTMSINAAGTGLEINDANGVPLGLIIENDGSSDSTAANLGIAGAVGAQLVGADLNPEAVFRFTETTGTTAADLGLEATHLRTSTGADLNPNLALTSNLSDLRNLIGFDGNRFILHQGESSYTVDLSDPGLVTIQDLLDELNNSPLDVTATINSSGQGIQIANNDTSRSLIIDDVGTGLVAKQMGLFGSGDMMGSMLILINALNNNDQEGISRLLSNFDDAQTVALEARAFVGTNSLRLEATASRLTDQQLNFTRLLSEVEDADLTKVITDLAMHENSYQAALMAAARIVQPTLLNFMR